MYVVTSTWWLLQELAAGGERGDAGGAKRGERWARGPDLVSDRTATTRLGAAAFSASLGPLLRALVGHSDAFQSRSGSWNTHHTHPQRRVGNKGMSSSVRPSA